MYLCIDRMLIICRCTSQFMGILKRYYIHMVGVLCPANTFSVIKFRGLGAGHIRCGTIHIVIFRKLFVNLSKISILQ